MSLNFVAFTGQYSIIGFSRTRSAPVSVLQKLIQTAAR